MNEISGGNESDAEPMSKDILEEIRDVSQYHPRINRRDVLYKICYCFKQR